jgi:hypothetical protein
MKITAGYILNDEVGATNPNERKDCVVRAIANATGMNYLDAHSVCKKHGRKNGAGTNWYSTHSIMQELGMKAIVFGKNRTANWFKNYDKQYVKNLVTDHVGGKTLKNLMQDLPMGKYVVYIRGHALALVDGKIIDTGINKANSRVIAIFYKH